MSLDVPARLLAAAERGEVDEPAFVACVRDSLPYAWQVVSDLADEMGSTSAAFVDHATPPPTEVHRGQLLRALASDAIRGALERHFRLKLAFQNCHRVAAFRLDATATDDYQAFVSPRAQLLNQNPALRDC